MAERCIVVVLSDAFSMRIEFSLPILDPHQQLWPADRYAPLRCPTLPIIDSASGVHGRMHAWATSGADLLSRADRPPGHCPRSVTSRGEATLAVIYWPWHTDLEVPTPPMCPPPVRTGFP